MYDEASAAYMSAAQEAMTPFPIEPFDWNPNVTRFFPFRHRQAVWDMCGYLWHRYYRAETFCQACRYNYGGHESGLERGRLMLSYI